MRELQVGDIIYTRLSDGRILRRKIARVTRSQGVAVDGFRIDRTPKGERKHGYFYVSWCRIKYTLETPNIKAEYERQTARFEAMELINNIQFNKLSTDKIRHLVNCLQQL